MACLSFVTNLLKGNIEEIKYVNECGESNKHTLYYHGKYLATPSADHCLIVFC